jgi:hypothetical protein
LTGVTSCADSSGKDTASFGVSDIPSPRKIGGLKNLKNYRHYGNAKNSGIKVTLNNWKNVCQSRASPPRRQPP